MNLYLHEELFFNEELHEYRSKQGLRYESATQFLGHFYKHFEVEEKFWLMYKSMQYLSDIDKPVKIKKYDEKLDKLINSIIFSASQYQQLQRYALSQCVNTEGNKCDKLFSSVFSYRELDEIERVSKLIKDSWFKGNKKSTRKGTAFHLFQENKQYNDKLVGFDGIIYNTVPQNNIIDWYNLEVGNHVELKLILPEFRLAGTSDQVIVKKDKKIIIRDIKTNIEIKEDNKYQNMLEPISHLQDCNKIHYYLQLSLYGYMLEQFGYEIEHIEFEWFDLEEVGDEIYKVKDSKIYICPYLKTEIKNMLNWYKINVLNK